MFGIIVSTRNVHKDEQRELKQYLEDNFWSYKILTQDELNSLISLVNYLISKRIDDEPNNLSYLDLLNLKDKLKDL